VIEIGGFLLGFLFFKVGVPGTRNVPHPFRGMGRGKEEGGWVHCLNLEGLVDTRAIGTMDTV
jgi:hypothetical protein